MKYGIINTVLRKSWEQALTEAKKLGFDGVELAVNPSETRNLKEIRQIRELTVKLSIELPSVLLFWPYTFADQDASNRKVAINLILHTIKMGKELGTWVILLPFFGAHELTPKQIISPTFISAFKKCAKEAELNHIYLAMETTLSADGMLNIIKEVNSPFVKVYFDVGNAVWWNYDPVSEIKTLGNEIIQIHIKDTRNGPGDVPLGEGKVRFDAVSQAIKDIGYGRYLVLETPATDEPVRAAARNLAYLKKYI